MSKNLIAVLNTLQDFRGIRWQDLRAELPRHDSKTFDVRDPAEITGICFHHNMGPTGGRRQVEATTRYHVGPNHISSTGCPGLCYTMAIGEDGTIYLCNDLEAVTWSQGRRITNRENLAVLVLGDFDGPDHPGGEPTPEQLMSCTALIVAIRHLWGDEMAVLAHSDLGKPACPGYTIERLCHAAEAHVMGRAQPDLNTWAGVQMALRDLGYSPGVVDGVPGPVTRSALCSFQADHDLAVDGVPGPRTRHALQQALSEA